MPVVKEDIQDKDGYRWWLWGFVTGATTVFVMDTSRSADVAVGQLGINREQTAPEAGRRLVISPDSHKAYQSLACLDGVGPLWCWTVSGGISCGPTPRIPQALSRWWDAWAERIAVLYRAHHAGREPLPLRCPGLGVLERLAPDDNGRGGEKVVWAERRLPIPDWWSRGAPALSPSGARRAGRSACSRSSNGLRTSQQIFGSL